MALPTLYPVLNEGFLSGGKASGGGETLSILFHSVSRLRG
jgi:hypothetical protein